MSETETPDNEPQLRIDHLHAFVHAIKSDPPSLNDPDKDTQLERMLRTLPDAFDEPLPPAFQLGPETVQRLIEDVRRHEHSFMLLVEDGPHTRRPKTDDEVKTEEQRAEEKRRAQKIKFFVDAGLGTGAFFGAQYTFSAWRQKRQEQIVDDAGGALTQKKQFQIDPVFVGAVMLVFVAAWFLAEAYTIARELWIDFTAWKRAVPIIGKKWVERDKAKLDD